MFIEQKTVAVSFAKEQFDLTLKVKNNYQFCATFLKTSAQRRAQFKLLQVDWCEEILRMVS